MVHTRLMSPLVAITALGLASFLSVEAALAAKTGTTPQADSSEPHVGLKMNGDGIEVLIDGELFTEYRFDINRTPVFYPLIGPGGENFTRHYPMKEGVEGELEDHVHHRSIWLGHHDVNGLDFWATVKNRGIVVQRKVRTMESGGGGKPAVIVVENDWVDGEGGAVCSDEREFRIRGLGKGEVLLDYIVTVIADKGNDVVFKDNKDGFLGIRVAPWLRLDDRKKNRGTGFILNSEGAEDHDAWGKRAKWVDYFGKAPDGKIYGLAMFDHPGNLRHPTWWHARNYGLLSANPFGQGDFEKGVAPEDAGDYTVPAGGKLRLHYCFYIHRGDPGEAKVAERYKEWASAGE